VISIKANGKSRQVAPETTIAQLLDELRLRPMQVLIEYNGEPLDREQFAAVRLQGDDTLEIAHMVGGG